MAVLELLGSWLCYAIAVLVLYSILGDGSATRVFALIGFGALFALR